MELKDIIEGLNLYYETFDDRANGHFIVNKRVDSNHVVKAIKTVTIQLYFVCGRLKYQTVYVQYSGKYATDEEITRTDRLMNSTFVCNLMKYVTDNEFKNLCHGEYPSKQIPD